MYKKYFSPEEMHDVKASEIRSLNETEKALTVAVGLMLVGGFFSFIFVVAMLIWFTKLTIFLSIISVIPTMALYLIAKKGEKTYKNKVEEIKKRISSQEKQAL